MSVPTLADVKTQLQITASTFDTELTTYLNAAIAAIERRVGPSTVLQFTDNVTTHATGLNLTKRPVVDIVSIVPLLNTFPTFQPTDVNFDARSGTVWRKDQGTLAGSYAVTYHAGYATFPDNYNLAVRLLVQHWWVSKRGAGERREPFPTMPGEGLPAIVEALIDDAPHFGGVF